MSSSISRAFSHIPRYYTYHAAKSRAWWSGGWDEAKNNHAYDTFRMIPAWYMAIYGVHKAVMSDDPEYTPKGMFSMGVVSFIVGYYAHYVFPVVAVSKVIRMFDQPRKTLVMDSQ